MFRRLPDHGGATVRFTVDGRDATARAGDSVATALLASGVLACRTTPVSGAERAPYCLMGVCFECLVSIDGIANRQGCLVPVEDGMRVERQIGRRAVSTADPSPAAGEAGREGSGPLVR